MVELEQDFERRVRGAIQECKSLGYYPNDFESMLETSSAVRLAERLVTSGDIQSGLKRVTGMGRPDLAIESIMLEPQFHPLFQQQLLAAARWRLDQAANG